MAKTFKYGGYTFEPRGQFKDFGIEPGKREMVEITRALHIADWNNRFNVADGNEHFDYDEFYKASGGSDADVFYCPETGELYVPSAKVLNVFDKTSTDEDVEMRYRKRIAVREERERFAKNEALKNAMCLTEKQHELFRWLCRVIEECQNNGLDFAITHETNTNLQVSEWYDLKVFRTDLLKDLTGDMAPLDGQSPIPSESMLTVKYGLWNTEDGLYANVK